ncbi:unnamed protein product [Adineta steineri]|uniref:Uncharacterized protein n=1 Tax=Adineta steineri TaxID=433720 RepID=A0A814KZ02_9BILA|nr:unnamed protein product [Adineta steineri]CAF1058010.1 unnamed protein product [Adineta steineri]
MNSTTRTLSIHDLSSISFPFGKIRIYFVLNGLNISRYLLCLISFDRWMITSRDVGIREKSSPELAR